MIDSAEVATAWAAAEKALAENSDLVWIKKSALRERAFFAGLMLGLEAIASWEDIRPVALKRIAGTMFSRVADDTFQSTHTSELLEAVRSEFLDRESEPAARTGALRSLSEHLFALNAACETAFSRNRELIDAAWQLCKETQTDSLRDDVFQIINEMERIAQHISSIDRRD